ncbi:MAG: ArsA family ATPase [Oscillatoriales cyanobacterium]|nr:MAG: ArsA family ATPase [Oscillatoriales cyanobacterium]
MAFTLTLLGKGGSGRSTLAIAAAMALASQGKRVLLFGQDAGPTLGMMLGTGAIGSDPQEISSNLWAVQPAATTLLERGWDEIKRLESEYLRQPFFRNVYGEELAVLPGMDRALALNALRQYEALGNYDAIVYDGNSDRATLLTMAAPEVLSWYVRRFQKVVTESDFAKAISPFVQPISMAVLSSGGMSSAPWEGPLGEFQDLLDRGRNVLADPRRVAGWLVANGDAVSQALAQYLWGSAQQAGLTVGGLFLNRLRNPGAIDADFNPLTVTEIPEQPTLPNWDALIPLMPDFATLAQQAPRPITIDLAAQQVKLFLPGFTKGQIHLTQSGPEVTIEAGEQRRNIFLPPALAGRSVKGAKFSDQYLIISF